MVQAALRQPESSEVSTGEKAPQEQRATIYELSFDAGIADFAKMLGKELLWVALSLGIYMPWLLAKVRSYFATHTRFFGEPFKYQVTGTDIFIDWLYRIAFIACFAGATFVASYVNLIFQTSVVCLGLVALTFAWPYVRYLTFRNRLRSRFWGRVGFNHAIHLKAFVVDSAMGAVLCLITLGLYFPVMLNKNLHALISGTSMGSMCFMYTGNAKHLLKVHAFYVSLAPLTLGISLFWYVAYLARYIANATWMGAPELGAARGYFNVKGGDIFGLFALNLFGFIFSLGIATPWLVYFNYEFACKRFKFYGKVDLERLNLPRI